MPRSRNSAILYLILVFASGILVGVVSNRLYMTTSVSSASVPPTRTADQVRQSYLSEMRAKVGVNDQQLSAVNGILDQTKRKYDDLHKKEKPLRDQIQQEQVDSISALLTPSQKTAYDNWRAERARLQAEAQKKKDQEKK
jgi:hypothetical protein